MRAVILGLALGLASWMPGAARAQEGRTIRLGDGVTLELPPPAPDVLQLPAPPFEDGLPPPDLREPDGLRLPPPAVQLGDPEIPGPPPDVDRPPAHGDGSPVAEFFAGLLGYAIGGLAGAGILALTIEDADDGGLIALGATAAIFLAGAGIAAGVDVAGDGTGGNGDYWAAFVGQLVGGIASLMLLGMAFVADPDGEGPGPALAVTGIIVLPVTGAVVGYGMSDDHND